ncbi:sugar (and other) transporter family protein [Ehrlichia chaffeensis str. Heartland]|uniref:Major facilitator family transporter n=1 Tax=Ehrlichia chaffeensis (strain ATCC CRL-10679 / Arkansas) TaxID=205920 RepID=Q2GHR6_EHRCR|nr:MFS transporter [Ehrlichia chaffeensis]ABD44809.1 major facilitator family transporter [Ehrlichia chaffeensis str. Arkansas]AHX04017.1 sugar (and other) transporter family protein [Ehrlichia chaffeensis str. Heartland]AHX05951.1 sugar (and other) transporter family protein [Ehrlichia chaffeensis str. Jax]AHX06941.1 sugar (and other) transporter family protein [Ehrlichia chaffeensis str. Liberty]AHX07363.1 sugar (and other) transporter family protein [Ehrlichia chaffeensis str. Osceola]
MNLRRAVLSTIMCNTLVWYDYVLFGNLVSVISKLFFPAEDRYFSLIMTFSIFAVGFLMRPFGASIFGYIGDKYGRKAALTLSIIAISVPITFISILPTYEKIGILSPILLIICRLMQGISLGGEAGNATFLIEHSKKGKNIGFFGSFETLSAVLGSIIALFMILLSQYFTGENFEVWGWRIPFVIGLLLGLISVYIRRITGESPAYDTHKENNNLSQSPFLELLKKYKRPLVLATCIDCVENCSFHIFMVFFITFIKEFSNIHLNLNANTISIIESFNIMICGILNVFFGYISDYVGRRKVMLIASVSLFCVAIPVFWLLSQDSYVSLIAAYLIFVIPFSATLGPASGAMSELFPTKVRYTGFGLSRNIASAISGGMAPVVCTWLIRATGLSFIPGVYVMFWALVGVIALCQIRKKDVYADW